MKKKTVSRPQGLTVALSAAVAAGALAAPAPALAAPAAPAAAPGVCAQSTLVNGGFDQPAGLRGAGHLLKNVPGWKSAGADGIIELWGAGNAAANAGKEVAADTGTQFAELNGTGPAAVWQDIETTPGTTLTWSLAHQARNLAGQAVRETMQIRLGAPGGTPTPQKPTGQPSADLTDGTAGWGRYKGTYKVPAGQTVTRVTLQPTSSSSPTYGNFVDSVEVLNTGCPRPPRRLCPVRGFGNGGFEQPGSLKGPGHLLKNVPGWRVAASDGIIELWGAGNAAANGGKEVKPDTGAQFAELNGTGPAAVYQDVETRPGTVLVWSLAHRARGRAGLDPKDTMQVQIGAQAGALAAQRPSGAPTADITDGTGAWGHYTGSYKVPAGQTTTRIALKPTASTGPSWGNFVDSVTLREVCDRRVVKEKPGVVKDRTTAGMPGGVPAAGPFDDAAAAAEGLGVTRKDG